MGGLELTPSSKLRVGDYVAPHVGAPFREVVSTTPTTHNNAPALIIITRAPGGVRDENFVGLDHTWIRRT